MDCLSFKNVCVYLACAYFHALTSIDMFFVNQNSTAFTDQFSQFQQFPSSNSVSSNHLKNLQVAVSRNANKVGCFRMSFNGFNGALTVEEFRDFVFFSNLTL